jgi:hypothetical protein
MARRRDPTYSHPALGSRIRRNVASNGIGSLGRRSTCSGVSVPAATGGRHQDGITAVQDVLALGVGHLTVDLEDAGRACFAAMDSGRREDRPLRKKRYGDGLVGKALQQHFLAETSAVLTGPSAVGTQPLMMHPERGDVFRKLDRCRRHVRRP